MGFHVGPDEENAGIVFILGTCLCGNRLVWENAKPVERQICGKCLREIYKSSCPHCEGKVQFMRPMSKEGADLPHHCPYCEGFFTLDYQAATDQTEEMP